MEKHPFKTISMRQLEEAFAAAVTAITNTETEVTVSMIKDVTDVGGRFVGYDSFSLDVSLTSMKAIPESPLDKDGDVTF